MVKINNLRKVYASKNSETIALDGVDLCLPDSGLVFVTGRSGSGKSTLLNMIGGLDRFSGGGSISYNGIKLEDLTENEVAKYRNKYVGFVFQDFELIETMTVYDNIRIALEMQGREDEAKIDEILKRLEIFELKDRFATKLSAGQKQRVAIARAIVKNPSIVLCDEPTGNLDSQSGRIILDFLSEMAKDRLVLIISHNKNESYKYADRIIELEKGKVKNDIQTDIKERNCYLENGTLYLNDVKSLTAENKEYISKEIQSGSIKRVDSVETLFFSSKKKEVSMRTDGKLEDSLHLKKKFKLFWNILGRRPAKSIVFSIVSMIVLSIVALCQMFLNFKEENYANNIVNESQIEHVSLISHGYEDGTVSTSYISEFTSSQREVMDRYDVHYVLDVGLGLSASVSEGGRRFTPEQQLSTDFYQSTDGTMLVDMDFLNDVFGNGGEAEILYAPELVHEGIYLTDYVADCLCYKNNTRTYDNILGEWSGYKGYVNGIINTGYKEKFKSFIEKGKNSETIDSEEAEAFLDYRNNYLAFCYSLLDYDDFVQSYIDSDYYKIVRFNSLTFKTSYNGHDTLMDCSIKKAYPKNNIKSDCIYFNLDTLNSGNNLNLTIDEWNNLLGNETYVVTLTNAYGKEYQVNARLGVWGDITSMGDDIVKEVKKNNTFAYAANFEKKSELLEAYHALSGENIRINLLALQNILRVMKTIDPYRNLFKFIELVLLIAGVVFVFYMSYSSVKRNNYNIGVLKAIGMSTSDLYGVYFINLFFQILLCAIFNVAFIFLFAHIGDDLLVTGITALVGSAAAYFKISIFTVTPAVVLLSLLTVFLILLAGVIIPIFKIRNIRPIDIIRSKY